MVRLALLTSVTCTPPALAPPVRLYSSHESMVPTIAEPSAMAAATSGTCRLSQSSLVAEKYVEMGNPQVARKASIPP
eukprot:CAMPEP_0119173416 /NCGR_PEP_ID=MMETSP1315-20130426/33684_1 /TAXON_ID=676789 /ORGANISM="Prasinoderma singularis, Strain RCC927" /LENGTH=76 /DNA_ID=CAMNT_0007167363 /DNA_START=47 /DNA_END=274 /DNA_ORIENTATION=+